MIEAEVCRKAVEVEGSEDCLTSTVFGLLKYSDMRPALASFLGRARLYASPERRLSELLPASALTREARLRFWDRHGDYGEPDLLLLDADLAIVIEVKYGAALSGADQLRKYRAMLDAHYPQRRHRHVVYLTPDLAPPSLAAEAVAGLDDSLWWLSWLDLSEALGAAGVPSPTADEIAHDLLRLLRHRGLAAFAGFSVRERPEVTTHFWEDEVPLIGPHAGFNPRRSYFWQGGEER